MEEFLIEHGLLAVLILAAVEGDVTLILAGVVAHLGFFDLPPAVCAGTVGAFAGDCLWYWAGRSRAATIHNTRIYRRVGSTAEHLADRLGAAQIILCRFVYGTRIATMMLWGARRLAFARFAIMDIIGSLIWASALAVLGYLASGSAAALIGEVKRVEIWLLVALAASVSVILAVRLVTRGRLQKAGLGR